MITADFSGQESRGTRMVAIRGGIRPLTSDPNFFTNQIPDALISLLKNEGGLTRYLFCRGARKISEKLFIHTL